MERSERQAVWFLLCSLQKVQDVLNGTETEEIMKRIKGTLLIAAGILAGMLLSGPAGTALAALTANPSSQTFYLDGQRVNLQAYEINGSNYVKLRDIGQAVDFGVAYDAATNSVYISPDQPYVEEVKTTAVGTGDGYLTNGKPITEENVLEILRQIEKDWPQGTTWGIQNTPGTHKNEVPSTASTAIMDSYPVNSVYGCSGYAAMVSSLIFGDMTNSGRRVDDLSQIRPGDILFLVNNADGHIWHVMIALESPSAINAFHYTDGNHGRHIHWPDRSNPYGRENLDCYRGENKAYHLEAWTRYPENVLYTGNSVNAWPTGVDN